MMVENSNNFEVGYSGLLFKITAGFLNATTSVLKRVSVGSSKLVSVFIEASKNFYSYFLHD
jgi:hypothetical protein